MEISCDRWPGWSDTGGDDPFVGDSCGSGQLNIVTPKAANNGRHKDANGTDPIGTEEAYATDYAEADSLTDVVNQQPEDIRDLVQRQEDPGSDDAFRPQHDDDPSRCNVKSYATDRLRNHHLGDDSARPSER